jgi:hypothetical protein
LWPFYLFVYLFIYLAVLGLKLRAFTLSHFASPSCDGCFWNRVSQTICQGWLQTAILLISASWIARITGMSHWYPAQWHLFIYFIFAVQGLAHAR